MADQKISVSYYVKRKGINYVQLVVRTIICNEANLLQKIVEEIEKFRSCEIYFVEIEWSDISEKTSQFRYHIDAELLTKDQYFKKWPQEEHKLLIYKCWSDCGSQSFVCFVSRFAGRIYCSQRLPRFRKIWTTRLWCSDFYQKKYSILRCLA